MDNILNDSQLWIVDADSKNSWFHYLNYMSRFQISKYFSAIKKSDPMTLYVSAQDFPAAHVLFIDPSQEVSQSQIKTTWEMLGKPKTMVFPSSHRVFVDLINIDRDKFRLMQ